MPPLMTAGPRPFHNSNAPPAPTFHSHAEGASPDQQPEQEIPVVAWIRLVQQEVGVAYKVIWREPDSQKRRSRNFHALPDAEAFRDEMNVVFPSRRGRGRRVSRPPLPIEERILRVIKIDDNGCWRWQLAIHNCGYGKLTVIENGRPRRRLAHRISYQHFVGPIPTGLHIDHLCRVRDCVNPKHLEPVTVQENLRRSPLRGARARATGRCTNGHVLAEVGLYKQGRYQVCAECQKAATCRSKQRRKAVAA